MFTIDKTKMQAAIESCLRGEEAGYYDLFWWGKDAYNFTEIFTACYTEMDEQFNELVAKNDVNASCLKTMLEAYMEINQFRNNQFRSDDFDEEKNQCGYVIGGEEPHALQAGLKEQHAPTYYLQGLWCAKIHDEWEGWCQLNIYSAYDSYATYDDDYPTYSRSATSATKAWKKLRALADARSIEYKSNLIEFCNLMCSENIMPAKMLREQLGPQWENLLPTEIIKKIEAACASIFKMATEYFEQASALNFAPAIMQLAEKSNHLSDWLLCMPQLILAIGKGYVPALYNMANLFINQEIIYCLSAEEKNILGIGDDYSGDKIPALVALTLKTRAAERGDVRAMESLIDYYTRSYDKIVEKNPVEANYWAQRIYGMGKDSSYLESRHSTPASFDEMLSKYRLSDVYFPGVQSEFNYLDYIAIIKKHPFITKVTFFGGAQPKAENISPEVMVELNDFLKNNRLQKRLEEEIPVIESIAQLKDIVLLDKTLNEWLSTVVARLKTSSEHNDTEEKEVLQRTFFCFSNSFGGDFLMQAFEKVKPYFSEKNIATFYFSRAMENSSSDSCMSLAYAYGAYLYSVAANCLEDALMAKNWLLGRLDQEVFSKGIVISLNEEDFLYSPKGISLLLGIIKALDSLSLDWSHFDHDLVLKDGKLLAYLHPLNRNALFPYMKKLILAQQLEIQTLKNANTHPKKWENFAGMSKKSDTDVSDMPLDSKKEKQASEIIIIEKEQQPQIRKRSNFL